jgi:hypothetical protein
MIRAVVRAQYLRLAAAPEEPRQLRHDVARPDRTVDATPERDALWPFSGLTAGFFLQPFRDSGPPALHDIGVKPSAPLVASAARRERRS